MTKFLDGPASGLVLMLRRSPLYLRVALERRLGTWDALDQADDAASGAEDYTAYRLVKSEGHVHIRGGKGGPNGYFQLAEYAVCKVQPDDATMRDQTAWREWVNAALQAERGPA